MTPSGRRTDRPWPNSGSGSGFTQLTCFLAAKYVLNAIIPSGTTTRILFKRCSSSRKYGLQFANSDGSGLLPGGEQWMAAVT